MYGEPVPANDPMTPVFDTLGSTLVESKTNFPPRNVDQSKLAVVAVADLAMVFASLPMRHPFVGAVALVVTADGTDPTDVVNVCLSPMSAGGD